MENLNIKKLFKRVFAYMIDIMVVVIITSLLSYIPIFNKNSDKYQTLYNEYGEIYEEYTNINIVLNDSYEDETISIEEYEKLIEIETYKEFIESKYDDGIIDESEYKKITKEITEKYTNIAQDYNYKMQKAGISNSVLTITSTFIYFGIIQYFLKGQTIGKKILKLKVVSANDKKINILNFILRTLIINNVLLNTIDIILLASISKDIYFQSANITSLLKSIIEAITIFLVMTRQDNRGLHDLLFNTKVIDLETSEIEKSKESNSSKTKTKKKKIIDAKYQEK